MKIKPKASPRRAIAVLIILLFALGSIAMAAHTQKKPTRTKTLNKTVLSSQEKKVIEYLKNDWGKDYSVTTVDLAMASLGISPSDEMRFKVGNYIKHHPELHEVIRRWGCETLVLTQNEKLIARAIINAQRDNHPIPSESEIAQAAGISMDETRHGLDMLTRYQILSHNKTTDSYQAAARYLNWQPRLDFLFHTVKLSSGRQFNTN